MRENEMSEDNPRLKESIIALLGLPSWADTDHSGDDLDFLADMLAKTRYTSLEARRIHRIHDAAAKRNLVVPRHELNTMPSNAPANRKAKRTRNKRQKPRTHNERLVAQRVRSDRHNAKREAAIAEARAESKRLG